MSKNKPKFHYFKKIFWQDILDFLRKNLKAIQYILLTTYKIYKDKLKTHLKNHFKNIV